jgi:flagellar protein FlbD
MAVNSDLIMLMEMSHDTVITLLTGEKLIVRENTEEVISRILNFRRAILSTESLGANVPHHCLSREYKASDLSPEDR